MASLIHYRWWAIDKPYRTTRCPWGFVFNEDKTKFIPVPEKLDYLEMAKDYLKEGRSSREMAEWLTSKTGESITHTGLNKRIKRDNEIFKNTDFSEVEEFYSQVETTMLPTPSHGLSHVGNEARNQDSFKDAKSSEEKKIIREKLKLKEHKRQLTNSRNRLKNLVKGLDKETKGSIEIPADIQEEIFEEEQDIIFKPNEGPQEDFLAATEDEVFYGGARGGGKTYALIADPLRYCGNGNFRGLYIRRTMPELRDIIHLTKKLYPKAYPGAKYHETDKIWNFPSGARIEFGYAENADDAERYRGQAYTWVGIDELPQYPNSEVYDLVKSSVRSTDPTLPTYIRCTGNPGNVGSAWVKSKFIDPAPANTTFFELAKFYNPLTKQHVETKRTLKYIPARVWDNPTLLHDESYVAALATLSDIQRKQMLEGNWDVVAEGAFPEFDRTVHVIEPFRVPGSWLKFRAADWGFSSPFCVLWMAVDWDGNIYVYREWYGQNVYDKEWAENIVRIEKEAKDYVEYGVIDGSTNDSRGVTGPTIFETINKTLRKNGVVGFKPADKSQGSRAAGKQAVHRYLALKETGKLDTEGNPIRSPSLFIFNTCVNLIRTLPMLQVDSNDPEKVAKKNSEDHAYDALHYGLRSRPRTAKSKLIGSMTRQAPPKVIDPVFGH